MHSAIFLCLTLAGLCTVTHGHHLDKGQDEHNSTNPAALKLYKSVADFAIKLYGQLSSASPDKNVFFSPLSIISAFSLLSLGAKSATRTQILEGLRFNLTEITEEDINKGFHDVIPLLTRPNSGFQLDLGQALFLKDDLKPLQTFLDDAKAFYDTEVLHAKFQEPKEAKKQVNHYVARKTNGKIVELIKDLDPETELAIVDYIVFKGTWKKPFDPALTTEKDFFVDQETTISVPMMHGTGWFDYYFDAELSCTVLQLDYQGSATAFFVLPAPGKLKVVEEALSLDTLTKWAERVSRNTAEVYLPKFNISASYELNEPLARLGITDVFSDHTDLSGITGQPLKVSKATHKAVLTVDERGTEAATTTAIEMTPLSPPPTIHFNHTFLMMSFHKETNLTLTISRIAIPNKQ
ncbi:alpha-1-antiproteinase 2-like [Rhineura floridana]|uniref:alpha-1-antiproteinase 2-like n=1 Tax=Rhineura floridana TaxID=261503 RepID=UPI002AC823D8|nr:alpha-1-antiproteinase 2-like [Rhineura floridana]